MIEPTRVVLVSGHVFGLQAFKGIFASPAFLDGRIDVSLMIGLDARFAGGTVGYRSLAELAADHGVPHVSTTDGRLTSLAETIRNRRPHYILVIGWSRLVSQEVLLIPGRYGCIGMHPTKLPTGRGQAPIPWTIIKGLETTALSVFLLEAEADTGPIVAQYDLAVHRRETAASLVYRMEQQHFVAGLDLAEALASRAVNGRPQDSGVATRWPKRRPADGEIRPDMTYAEIDSLVRALLGPYPRAFVSVDGRRCAVAAAEVAGPDERQDWIRLRCRDAVVDLRLESG